jgi:hypothetical protein
MFVSDEYVKIFDNVEYTLHNPGKRAYLDGYEFIDHNITFEIKHSGDDVKYRERRKSLCMDFKLHGANITSLQSYADRTLSILSSGCGYILNEGFLWCMQVPNDIDPVLIIGKSSLMYHLVCTITHKTYLLDFTDSSISCVLVDQHDCNLFGVDRTIYVTRMKITPMTPLNIAKFRTGLLRCCSFSDATIVTCDEN